RAGAANEPETPRDKRMACASGARVSACRAGFDSRGTAVARDTNATFSPPGPRPKKSWVALLDEALVVERFEILPGAGADLVALGGRQGRCRLPVRLGRRRPDGPPRVDLVERRAVPARSSQAL